MKFSYQLAVLMSVIWLTGCGSTPVTNAPINQVPQTQSSSNGLVFVHFPRTMPEQIWIKSTGSDEGFYLLENNPHKSTAQLWLPPGEYKLYSLMYGKGGTLLENYPSFTVKADNITNLGGLSDFSVGGGKLVWLPKSTKQTKVQLNSLRGRLGSLLTTIKVDDWQVNQVPPAQEWITRKNGPELIPYLRKRNSDNTAKGMVKQQLMQISDIDSFYQTAVPELPPIANQTPAMDDQGNLYFGGEFGLIKKRNPEGKWSNIDTQSQQPIRKVVWIDNMLFAAGRDGLLVKSEDNGASWQTIKTFDLNEQLHDIAVNGQNFMVLATAPSKKASEVLLYHSGYSASPKFARETVFTKDIPHGSRPFGVLVKNRFYIGLTRSELAPNAPLFPSTTSYYFDNGTFKFHGSFIPRAYSYFNVAKGGQITAFYSIGVLSGLLYSNDGGNSWQDRSYPSVFTSNAIFSDDNNATALSYRVAQNRSKSYKLHRFDSVTNNWQKISDVPQECKYMLKDQNNSVKFCITLSDKILSADSKGWRYERYQ